MKFDMNIKTKLTVSIGVLVAMIVFVGVFVGDEFANTDSNRTGQPGSRAGNEPCIDMDYDYRWHLHLHRFVDSV